MHTYKKKILHESISFQTYNDLAFTIKKIIPCLPSNLDLIVGIPRSGMIPAYMIGAFINCKVCSLDEFIIGLYGNTGERPLSNKYNHDPKNILIVDDSIDSGTALNRAKLKIPSDILKDKKIEYLAVYARDSSKHLVDYYGKIIPQPRIFQWNYLHHNILSKSCMDIDGVLCVDPSLDENDDGEKYMYFIRNAKPLYIPPYKIYALVTSRLEKYRIDTEYWLAKYGVQYETLYMLDLPTAEERRKLNYHAIFKAKVYSKLSLAELFIESEPEQAQKIAELTHKPVICVKNDEYYGKDS
jgi:uncharacterized HAD superfamily protein